MNQKLLAIASLCAFSLSACQSSGSTASEFAETYRLHTPDGVIITSDPEIIAAYRLEPNTTIVALGETAIRNPIRTAENAGPSAP